MSSLRPTPLQMVTGGRVSAYGAFDAPFRNANPLDAALRTAGLPWPRALKRLRLKEWTHVVAVHHRYLIGMVIFDAKFLVTSFFHVTDLTGARPAAHVRDTPLRAGLRIARQLWRDHDRFHTGGYTLRIAHRLEEGHHRVQADIRQRRGQPPVQADLKLFCPLDQITPLVAVLPVAKNRPFYTHKAPCPVEGAVRIGSETIRLDPDRHTALLDVQKTFYPYRTFWNWATFAGFDSDGRRVALNLCSNIVRAGDAHNENCAWVEGKIRRLGQARFDFDPKHLRPWRLTTLDGTDLTFHPLGEKSKRTRVGPLQSDFHQPYGRFSGRVPGPDGEVAVDGLIGVCEHHVARF